MTPMMRRVLWLLGGSCERWRLGGSGNRGLGFIGLKGLIGFIGLIGCIGTPAAGFDLCRPLRPIFLHTRAGSHPETWNSLELEPTSCPKIPRSLRHEL